jgi:hypothetical protein
VLIEVSDSGVGVSEARLAEMNERLDSPPVIDVSVSRHMGLFAVARLAERHGVRVRLRAGSPRGLTALVWLPDTLTDQAARPLREWSEPRAAQADYQARQVTGRHSIDIRSAAVDQSTTGRPDASVASMQLGADPRAGVRSAESVMPNWFASRRASATATASYGGTLPGEVPQAGSGRLAGADGWAEGRQAARIIADPVRGDSTVSGLPVRVPQANLIPGSAGGGPQAKTPAALRPQRIPQRIPQRSPELARSRLSGFQRGTRRAKGQSPGTGEGADR